MEKNRSIIFNSLKLSKDRIVFVIFARAFLRYISFLFEPFHRFSAKKHAFLFCLHGSNVSHEQLRIEKWRVVSSVLQPWKENTWFGFAVAAYVCGCTCARVYIVYIYFERYTRYIWPRFRAYSTDATALLLIIDRSPSSFHPQRNWKANLDLITDRVFCLKGNATFSNTVFQQSSRSIRLRSLVSIENLSFTISRKTAIFEDTRAGDERRVSKNFPRDYIFERALLWKEVFRNFTRSSRSWIMRSASNYSPSSF